jgi:hypothetical protein
LLITPEKKDSVILAAELIAEYDTMPDEDLSRPAGDSVAREEDITDVSPLVGKWSITFGYGVAKSYTNYHEDYNYQFIAQYRDSTDEHTLSGNAHLSFTYEFSPRFEVFTGIGIINYKQKIRSDQVVYRYDSIPASLPVSAYLAVSRGHYLINGDATGMINNSFSFLQIPLGIRYTPLNFGRFNIGIQPEVSFNKIITSRAYIYDYSTRKYRQMDSYHKSSFNISYGIGIPIQFRMRNNLALEVMPYFHSMRQSIYANSYQFSQTFNQAEARMSLRYSF